MTADEIHEIMAARGATPIKPTAWDEEYSLPDWDWVLGTFSKAYLEMLRQKKLREYKKRRNDCGKFSLRAMTYASDLHGIYSNRETGFGFGVFEYLRDKDSEGHVLNVAIIRAPRSYEVKFWDAQDQKEKKLSEQEIQNCQGYLYP